MKGEKSEKKMSEKKVVSPTPKQKRVARRIIENLGKDIPESGGDIVESSGYGKSMRLFPGRILESKGVKEELRRLGFSVEAADQVIWQLLHRGKREETRLLAAREVYKRMGAYKDTEQGAGKTLVISGNKITFVKFNESGSQ